MSSVVSGCCYMLVSVHPSSIVEPAILPVVILNVHDICNTTVHD